MNYFDEQLTWSKKLNKKAINLMYKILERHFREIINIRESSLEIDRKFATDLTLITFNSNSIAVRMRRMKICKNKRDLTIQTQQASGNRHNTEYIKLFKKGYVRWYLYCWVKDDMIKEWMFIDLDILRKRKIIEQSNELTNTNDGQHFIAIPFTMLLENNCIIEYNIKTKTTITSYHEESKNKMKMEAFF